MISQGFRKSNHVHQILVFVCKSHAIR